MSTSAKWREQEAHHARASVQARDSFLFLRRLGHSGAEGARVLQEEHEAQAAECRRFAEQEEATS